MTADRRPHTRHARTSARLGSRYPTGWEVTSEDVECILLKLPPDVTRVTASMRLALQAEFGGWELSRVRLYSDGTRKVLLKRRRPPRGARELDEDRSTDHDPRSAQAC
ncbi:MULTISPECIES: DUF5703 family protein [Gordonia]|uniref:DUF5703 family protein n=1 Tax=Gordonia amicalis TaxID=89053 RepID=A0ABU4DGE7_9ACTN|nr:MULTISPECIES: DUF5703 family protein [Gordonia]ATD70873.1 hypothetical protein CNO18_11940 [Gordonia sp. 1D]KAF0969976.1 hypothetical protein BPODLACK_01665 [Gordonia sp. YY1]MCR8897077.1 DUF5703 family protein [Gordonia sp. GONU]MCZ0913179.1 DUF5703 family protein [Gordonia amicalis]MCZ4580256.1 DUF5703 family protein [Gordonia amicalis]